MLNILAGKVSNNGNNVTSGTTFVDGANHLLDITWSDGTTAQLDINLNDTGRINVTLVPEPATAALALFGLGGLLLRRKRIS